MTPLAKQMTLDSFLAAMRGAHAALAEAVPLVVETEEVAADVAGLALRLMASVNAAPVAIDGLPFGAGCLFLRHLAAEVPADQMTAREPLARVRWSLLAGRLAPCATVYDAGDFAPLARGRVVG